MPLKPIYYSAEIAEIVPILHYFAEVSLKNLVPEYPVISLSVYEWSILPDQRRK